MELVTACVGNFLAKFDCAREGRDTEREQEGPVQNGRVFWVLVLLPWCMDRKDPGEGGIEESSWWVGSAD